MPIVTPSELNTICTDILNLAYPYNFETYAFFFTAINSGLRAREIVQLTERITSIGSGNVLVETEKTGAIRTIPDTLISKLFLDRYAANKPALMLNSYLSLNHFVKRAGYAGITVNGSKKETMHLFRHNKAKQLQIAGQTTAQIAAFYEVTEPIALIYIKSVINRP